MHLKLPILQADVRTANGRVYPRALLEKIVRETIPERVWVFTHGDGDGSGLPNLSNLGGCVRKLSLESGQLIAEVQFARNESGALLSQLALQGVGFTVSGVGSLDHGYVQDDYRLDAVIPSALALQDWRLRQLARRKIIRARRAASGGSPLPLPLLSSPQ